MSEYHAEGSHVYHNNNQCTLGNNIEPKNKRPGRGGNNLCSVCQTLNKGNLKSSGSNVKSKKR